MHTWQAGNRHKRFTFADAALNARCSRALLLRALADRERCTRRPWAGAAQKVRPQSRNAVTRTLSTRREADAQDTGAGQQAPSRAEVTAVVRQRAGELRVKAEQLAVGSK